MDAIIWKTITKKGRHFRRTNYSFVRCHVSSVICIMLHVTCSLPPVTNASSHSHSPPPANSPTIHNRLVCEDPKAKNQLLKQKKNPKILN